MAVGIAEILLLGLVAAWVFNRLRVPGLIGMLLVGVLLGPYVLGYLSDDLLAVSADLRLVALIVILLRAGFEISRKTLHRVGLRAALLSFIPALLEGVAVTLLGPVLLGLTYMESALLGSVLAAVSPAVVVPMMIDFIKRHKGTGKGIPTMVLAAASLDDVIVIVAYSALVGFYTGQTVNLAWKITGIPIGIILGVVAGLVAGVVLIKLFERFNPRATKRVLVVVALAVLLVRVEHVVEAWLPFAALLSAMAMGYVILEKREHMAHEISAKLGKVWVFAQILLFAMVGSQVNIHVAWQAGTTGAALIGLGVLVRALGTWLCLWRSQFNLKERLFVAVAYTPKATVQAAIGAAPLAAMKAAGMATGPGEVILAVAVLSIVLTAPLGAWAIAFTGNRVLTSDTPEAGDDAYRAALESDPPEP